MSHSRKPILVVGSIMMALAARTLRNPAIGQMLTRPPMRMHCFERAHNRLS